MKFTLIVKHTESGRISAENYDKPDLNTLEKARDKSKEWLNDFNSGLRPFEEPRKFLAVLEGNHSQLIDKKLVDYRDIKVEKLTN